MSICTVTGIPRFLSFRARAASSLSTKESIPPYPFGPSKEYKQRNQGLYGRSRIQSGNIVSEKNEIKTRRVWRVNVHYKRLWSSALQRFVPLKVQARVLRTIDKCGGLDEYLLGNSPGRIKQLGVRGWELRWRLMQTPTVQARHAREMERLGLSTLNLSESAAMK